MKYLDNASTTKISRRVLDGMMPYLEGWYGNPGSVHSLGKIAKDAVETARGNVASLLGCKPGNIVFTSSGSESNNLVIDMVCRMYGGDGKNIVTTSVEHDSILNGLKRAKRIYGVKSRIVSVRNDGTVDPEEIKAAIDANTILVSVMHSNNELGSVNNIAKIGEICQNLGPMFHTDCVQAAGAYDLDVEKLNCDFLSVSAHKIHGPKGVGALYVRYMPCATASISGGDNQEFGLRGGTENVAGIAGLGAACEEISRDYNKTRSRYRVLKRLFYDSIMAHLEDKDADDIKKRITVNANSLENEGKVLSISVRGVDSETLVMALSDRGVCISSGSACTEHNQEPSHVLKAIGLSDEEARSTVRVSFDITTESKDVVGAGFTFADVITELIYLGENM